MESFLSLLSSCLLNGITWSPISVTFSLITAAILGRFVFGTHRSAHKESERKTLTRSLHLSVGTYFALFFLYGIRRANSLLSIIDFSLSVKRFLEIQRFFWIDSKFWLPIITSLAIRSVHLSPNIDRAVAILQLFWWPLLLDIYFFPLLVYVTSKLIYD